MAVGIIGMGLPGSIADHGALAQLKAVHLIEKVRVSDWIARLGANERWCVSVARHHGISGGVCVE